MKKSLKSDLRQVQNRQDIRSSGRKKSDSHRHSPNPENMSENVQNSHFEACRRRAQDHCICVADSERRVRIHCTYGVILTRPKSKGKQFAKGGGREASRADTARHHKEFLPRGSQERMVYTCEFDAPFGSHCKIHDTVTCPMTGCQDPLSNPMYR